MNRREYVEWLQSSECVMWRVLEQTHDLHYGAFRVRFMAGMPS